jgi:hypothetical protein
MISAFRMRSTFAGLAFVGAVSAVPRVAHAADPTMAECLAANESAISLRSDHKLREARDKSLACAASSCPAEVREACQNRVQQLNTAIPTIVFEVKNAAGADLTRVVVTMDGQPFADRLDGTALPLNPGEHVFVFAVDGGQKLEKRLVVYQGETNRREKIVIGGGEPAPTPASPSSPAQAPSTLQPPTDSARTETPAVTASPGIGAQRTLGLIVGGTGIVGIGVGVAAGMLASSAWSRVQSACGSGGAGNCSPSGTSRASVTSDHDTAETDGAISTVAFVAGGALVAAGLFLYLTGGPSDGQASTTARIAIEPTLVPGHAGFALSGGF